MRLKQPARLERTNAVQHASWPSLVVEQHDVALSDGAPAPPVDHDVVRRQRRFHRTASHHRDPVAGEDEPPYEQCHRTEDPPRDQPRWPLTRITHQWTCSASKYTESLT
ncbi:hypothetical protein emb_1d0585 [Coriobacteriaceae bacterium EMTCatB1]|nr:hypothetical protein emb_1d0585 [Coriobacteriaceae bacterium EMTCatB1]